MNDYLDAVGTQLAELTEQGAHRRLRARIALPGGPPSPRGAGSGGPRRRTELFAFASALAVTAAVVAIALTAGQGPHHPAPSSHITRPPHRLGHRHHATGSDTQTTSTTTSGSQPATGPSQPAGPVPAGFETKSFTAISELTWWLLGTAPCSSPPCTSIVRTNDGGRTFVGTPAPRTAGVSNLRFGDPSDGFAYGPQLWVTHDGGATWQRIGLSGQVTDLSIGDGYAYAIVRSTDGNGRLYRSPVGTNSWSVLPAAGDAFSGLWTHGSTVMLESSTSQSNPYRLLVSQDGGSAFTSYAVPPSVECAFEGPAAPVIWAHCATGMMSGVWRSTNGGASFTASQGAHGWAGPELPNSAAFGAASETTAVVGYQQLYRTTDGGASFSPVSAPSGINWTYLGFTDPTHGVAIGTTVSGNHGVLYYTTDAGQSYHLVTIG